MTKVSVSTVIHKPIEEVFDYTASPHNGPAFIPNLNENSNITPAEPGKGQTFNWRLNMAGVDLKGQGEVVEYNRPHRVKIVTTGDSSSTWVYTFGAENGGTKVTAEVEYEIGDTVLQKITDKLVVEKLNRRSAEIMLENLKTILES